MADEKKPFGRPTKLTDEVLSLSMDYINNHESYGDPVPTIEGLACELFISRNTLYRWAEEHKHFRDIFEQLKAKQARKLLAGGLTSDLNSTITKLMLTKHDYSDKQDLDMTSNGQTVAPALIQIVGIDTDDNSTD